MLSFLLEARETLGRETAEFITLLGGAAAWPLSARAQQHQLRRVAVVMQYVETDPQGQLRAAAFREGLEKAGWVSGRNISVDYLWGVMDSEWTRGITEHLRQRVPDVIAINSSIGLRAIESAAPGVPIVFIAVSEAQGFVASLAHPGGNMTAFPSLRLAREGDPRTACQEIRLKQPGFLLVEAAN